MQTSQDTLMQSLRVELTGRSHAMHKGYAHAMPHDQGYSHIASV